MSKNRALVIFSGGPDSTCAVMWAIAQGFDVQLVTYLLYDDRSYGEMVSSALVARELGLPHEFVDFKSPIRSFHDRVHVLMHGGTRDKASAAEDEPYLLPFGPGVMLSFSAGLALDRGCDHLVWGATKDDSYGGPEYSPVIAEGLADLIAKTTGKSLAIHTPLSEFHKFQIVKELESKSDLFPLTWTCIQAGSIQCGECPACATRRDAVVLANVIDKTNYLTDFYTSSLPDEVRTNPSILSDEDRLKFAVGQKPKKHC